MKTNRGFTLMEMLVVISLVLVMAAIAIPSFIKSTRFNEQVASAKTLREALNQATAEVKKTRYPASVRVNGGVIQVWRGVKDCAPHSNGTTDSGVVTRTYYMAGKTDLKVLTSSLIASSPTGYTLTTAGKATTSWTGSVTPGICIPFVWGAVGNAVEATGWAALGISGYDQMGMIVGKKSGDDRFEVWGNNGSGWNKFVP